MTILQSASKIVFILMAVATVIGTFLEIIDPKDFMMLASMAFSFYFANKGETNGAPFAGKWVEIINYNQLFRYGLRTKSRRRLHA